MTESPLAEAVAAMACFMPQGGEPSMFDHAQALVPFYPVDQPCNLLMKTAQAGQGDVEAQRELATFALYAALQGGEDADGLSYLIEGLMLARMAASHGLPGDQFLCATMLSLAACMCDGDSARQFAAETLARMELLADTDGGIGEQAARIVATCAEREAPETLEMAQQFRAELVAAQGA